MQQMQQNEGDFKETLCVVQNEDVRYTEIAS